MDLVAMVGLVAMNTKCINPFFSDPRLVEKKFSLAIANVCVILAMPNSGYLWPRVGIHACCIARILPLAFAAVPRFAQQRREGADLGHAEFEL